MSRTRRPACALAASLFCFAALAGGAHAAAPRISDGVVKIGVLTDLSGAFRDNVGPGSIVATELAVEDFGGKVLGMPIVIVTADHLNKPDVGATRVREWFDRDQVDVVTELGNSAVALAAIRIAQDKGRMAMITGAGAQRITNEDCSPNSVQWVFDTYAFAKVGMQAMVASGYQTWYFLTADYAFGQSLEADGTRFIQEAGGKVISASRFPVPVSDFSSIVLQAQASGADAIALATGGTDLQNAVRQAVEFGVPKKQKLAAMMMMLGDVHGLGLKDGQGMLMPESFYWDRDDDSRAFARRFFARTKRMPTALQAGQYSAVLGYLKAVQASGSDDVKDVMKALKSMSIDDAFTKHGRVRVDGKMVHDMYLVQVKAPSESHYPWDYLKILKTIPADQAFMPLTESKCPLVAKAP
jgi:branched-chain amino acid transport system substrate-binding protein